MLNDISTPFFGFRERSYGLSTALRIYLFILPPSPYDHVIPNENFILWEGMVEVPFFNPVSGVLSHVNTSTQVVTKYSPGCIVIPRLCSSFFISTNYTLCH